MATMTDRLTHPHHPDGTPLRIGDRVLAGTITGFRTNPNATCPTNRVLVQIDHDSYYDLSAGGLTPYDPPVVVTVELTSAEAALLAEGKLIGADLMAGLIKRLRSAAALAVTQ